jgi:hypothetical protein
VRDRGARATRGTRPLCELTPQDKEGEEVATKDSGAAAGSGAIYGLGIFGAWVYFWQQADGFWEYVLAFFQGILWPAFMVYEAFSALD